MAVTAYTLDRAERTKMYRQMRAGVLIALAFERVSIDGTDFYQPGTSAVDADAKGLPQRGVYVAQEIFDHPAPALPYATRPTAGQTPVWQYGGI